MLWFLFDDISIVFPSWWFTDIETTGRDELFIQGKVPQSLI